MPKSYQIILGETEKAKLVNRIEQDFLGAKAAHLAYAQLCASWLQRWEARVDRPKAGDEDKPNHVVPLVQWQSYNKLARDMQALLGNDAEITARATGPSDAADVAKIGRYMTSRVFDQMQLINPLCEFEFRRILNGWAAAYRPWWRREYTVLDRGKPKRVCDYEGPGFFPLEPDDLVIPAERGVKSIQDFSFVLRRVRVTVDDLQRGDGTLYQNTSNPNFVRELIDWAKTASTNDYTMYGQDPVREERERSELVDYDSYMLGRRSIWLWEWHGYWRPLKKRTRDAEVDDLERRLPFEADWVVRFIPGMRRIVGVQDLLDLYPKMRRRRPFVESTLIKDGTYRPKGFGALLGDLEDDATANSRLFTAAGELSVWPIVFFKPGGGMKPSTFKLGPGMAIPTEDPNTVKVVTIQPNLQFGVMRQQDILATGERVTGITDQSLGRQMDRPNAPRTATGQLALIEEGNVRAYLDATILREDMEQIIGDFWDLDCDLAPKSDPGLFFRVTEEQAGGLFDVRKGGAFMTPKEFGGRYDFRLKFATSTYARQAQKAELLGFYQLAVMNPLVASNPHALWSLLNRLAKDCGIDDFSAIVPEPPQPDVPKNPDEEWTLMLEGKNVEVNPQDHDDLHIQQHVQQLEDERKSPSRDAGAIGLMVKHILEHQQQKRTKMLMQTLTNQLAQSIMPQEGPGLGQQGIQQLAQMYQQQQGGGQSQPGQPQPGQPGMPPGAPGAPGGQGGPPDMPLPGGQVGSSAAPQPVDGML